MIRCVINRVKWDKLGLDLWRFFDYFILSRNELNHLFCLLLFVIILLLFVLDFFSVNEFEEVQSIK